MPSNCSAGPLGAVVRSDSWEEPGHYIEKPTETTLPTNLANEGSKAETGCDLLQFNPEIEAQPDITLADAPVGLGVNVSVPLNENVDSPATPVLHKATVTLPEGMSINPGIVDGIKACEESGPEGINFGGALSEERGLNGELQLAPGHCPDASIIGEAEAETPLLASPVKGHVYLAKPLCGGPGQLACTEQDARDGSTFHIYLLIEGQGVLVKLEGSVEANKQTGQLTSHLDKDRSCG